MPEAPTLEAQAPAAPVTPTTTPAPAPAPTATPATPQASPVTDWLPAELKGHATLSKFKSPGDVARSYVELEHKIGQKGILIPGKDAKPEELAKFRADMGVPEAPDKYRLPTEGIPEGFAQDKGFMDAMFAAAHKTNVPEEAFAEIYRAYATHTTQRLQELDAQVKAQAQRNDAELSTEWGNSKAEKFSMAKRGLTQFVGAEKAQAIMDAKHEPQWAGAMRTWAQVGKALASHPIHGAGSAASFQRSPAEAKAARMAWEGTGDNQKALSDSNHARHEAALAEWTAFFKDEAGA